ncbi:zinc transport system substrate-binding protein [Stella humosa]|uniref:High-affinity zinc uptake system protein ZnuA n=1 Tax=Stella humosa TaxID=94 RepID=A0A3N1KYF0_9PROT|nr:zinc ABC transporter substrate-binding protein [Stella humosa]ROP83640.1 zinc transport system substrate-binding protein [Stella humosa]BBK33087.1 zinc ABC transporter substrate-binding protein [Stella humosa]
MPRRLFAAALAAASIALAHPAVALDVVTTVKPIHSLVAAVMAGGDAPHLLIGGTASPHTYALRPSDARRLEAADLVVWVGPTLETPLARPIASLARPERVLTLTRADGVHVLDAREGGPWEADDHDHGHKHGTKGAAEESDGHLWLDPTNAAAIAVAVAERLAGLDPGNAARYRANAERLRTEVAALDQDLAHRLAAVRQRPFLVFHDAYQYLEQRYSLTAVGAIAISPERKPGARRIQALRRRVAETGAACVFSEPQFDAGLVATVTEGTKARTAVLDPLGASLKDGPALYPALMRAITGALAGCLAPTT